MLIEFSDQVVVVSGAARGIGKIIAERFADEGAIVVALDLEFSTADVGKPNRTIAEIACDVSDPESVQQAIAEITTRFGRVDVLVNNAGINVEGLIEDLDFAAWRKCMDVNVGGVFLLSQAVAPVMKGQGSGRIINAASFAAIVPSVASGAYAASKAAVVQLTRVLASELGPWNITVNAYAPGMVPTAMNGFADMDDISQGRLLDTLSLRRWETPDDVANVLCFLASAAASYITGALIDVSGGKLATQIPSRAYEYASVVKH